MSRCASIPSASLSATHFGIARRLAAIVLCAAAAACDGSTPLAPIAERTLPRIIEPWDADLSIRESLPTPISLLRDNANVCIVHLAPSKQSRTSVRLNLPMGSGQLAPEVELSRIQFVRWDGISKQPSALVDCVVPRDRRAIDAVKEYFLRGAGTQFGRRAHDTLSPSSTALANTFYDGMTCWYDHGFNEFDCEGVGCRFGGHAIRLSSSGMQLAASMSSTPAAFDDPNGYFVCDNGCTLWADGMGNVGFRCPEDGGGDEPGGSGGGGGGGTPPVDTASIELTCSNSAPVRGSSVSCSATNPGAGVYTISLWVFEPEASSLGMVTAQMPDSQWRGTMVASGRVIVEATSAGAAIADTFVVQVTPRQGFGTGSISMDIPSPLVLPYNDISTMQDLGNVLIEPSSSALHIPVSGGPNDGYIILSDTPDFVATISVAANALVTGAPFLMRHPLYSTNGTCTRQFVRDQLPGLILQHEGANLEAGSHTQRYLASLQQNAQQLRELSESIVMSGGGSEQHVIFVLSPVTGPALQASALADVPPSTINLSCNLLYNP